MMKTKTSTLSGLIVTFILMISIIGSSLAQGSLAISKEQSDGTRLDIGCGSFYTTLLPHEDLDQNLTLKEDTWTLTNDGNETLTIQVPLIFAPGASSFLQISSQPQGTLSPGESTTFTTSYRHNANDDGTGFLPISTSSVINGECGFLLRGMLETVSLCNCYCDTNNEIIEVCPFDVDGFITGISIAEELCESNPTNPTCSSISLSGSCDCGNLRSTAAGQDLFIDTLRVNGLPSTDVIITENNDSGAQSLLNLNGASIRRGTVIGTINSRGFADIPIFRRPGTAVSVMINGVRYTSDTLCPEVGDCVVDQGNETSIPTENMEAIPTLSEWSIFLLYLILLNIGLVSLRLKVIANKSDKKLML